MLARISMCLLVLYHVQCDVDIITEPRPGEEYVLVSSGQQTALRNFETAHKIPEKHPSQRGLRPDDVPDKALKKYHSVKSGVRGHPAPAAEGIVAIEEEKHAFHKKAHKKQPESIEIDVPVSKLEDIKIKEDLKNVETNPGMGVLLEAMSESGKLSAGEGTTTQKPVLTTTPAPAFDIIPINFDSIDDINAGLLSSNVNLETAASEQKQHSRIQVKKGPNGQDYEYEYIYYYYDDDEQKGNETAPVHNGHDVPQKVEADNQIAKDVKGRGKYSSIDRSGATTAPATAAVPEASEVSPARSRQRGRTMAPAPVQEDLQEDRLPSSTRFPPRGRTIGTTYMPEVTEGKRRPSSDDIYVEKQPRRQPDNVADESIGQTRSRTRAHIRRPSSELVDLDSFKTHSGDIPTNQYKEPPSRYSSESKTTTEEPTPKESTPKEPTREGHSLLSGIRFQEIIDDSKLPADYKTTTISDHETTEYTTMTAMEKVALDLYAYLAGENLNNEINPTVDDLPSFDGSTTIDDGSWTTEALSTTDDPPTTTTTTTTTTPPPPPSTAAPAPTRPSRFKLRPGSRARASTTTTTTDAPEESSTRARGRFGKPKPGGRRTTAAPAAPDASTVAPEEKPFTKAAFGRRGLFAGRTRAPSSTPAPADAAGAATNETPSPRPIVRPGLRRLPSSTTTIAAAAAAVPGDSADSESSPQDPAEITTPSGRTIGRGRPALRPLRPGPRLNLRPSPRLRPSTAAPDNASEAPADAAPAAAEVAENTDNNDNSESASSAAPEAQSPVRGVRPRTRLIAASPRPRVAVTSPPRRPNPLLKRKATTAETTTESKPVTTEEATDAESKEETETDAVAETTPAPPLRGLDALFARRRAAQAAARTARPAKRAARS